MSKPRAQKKPLKNKEVRMKVVKGVTPSASMQTADFRWMIRDMVPLHAVNIIEGHAEAGKSTILAAIAAAWSGGPKLPRWEGPSGEGVFWLSGEDPWPTVVKNRLIAAAANEDLVCDVELEESAGMTRSPLLPSDIAAIEARMLAFGATLLIVDPLSTFVTDGADLSFQTTCRPITSALHKMCLKHSFTVILVRHLKKDYKGSVRHAGYGHGDLFNAARSVSRVDVNSFEPTQRYFSTVKCNWREENVTQLFRIVKGVGKFGQIEWTGRSPLSASQIAGGATGEIEIDEAKDADVLLVTALSEGPRAVKDLQKDAFESSITPSSMRTAKKKLGIVSMRVGGSRGHFVWLAPPTGFPESLVKQVASLTTSETALTFNTFEETKQKPKEKKVSSKAKKSKVIAEVGPSELNGHGGSQHATD